MMRPARYHHNVYVIELHEDVLYERRYGLRLMPEIYDVFNPMPWAAALQLEAELAQELREKGWAVWQG